MVARVPPEAFDRSHIEDLLAELTGSAAASASAAIILAPILSAAGLTAHFAHVGPARYIDPSGQVIITPTTAQHIRSDQQQARQAYNHTHAVALTTAGPLGAAVGALGAAIAGGTPMATTLRGALAHLFPGLVGGKVPIRDLSDHAPINYVSAIVRSFGTAARSC